MIILPDERVVAGSEGTRSGPTRSLFLAPAGRNDLPFLGVSAKEREELAYSLLASLPRSRLANIQRRIAPLLQIDFVGLLPPEVSLQIFSYLSFQSLLTCALVSRRWRAIADDTSVWKDLCFDKGWTWKQPPPGSDYGLLSDHGKGKAGEGPMDEGGDDDDEGMGDEEDEIGDVLMDLGLPNAVAAGVEAEGDDDFTTNSTIRFDEDSGFASTSWFSSTSQHDPLDLATSLPPLASTSAYTLESTSPLLPDFDDSLFLGELPTRPTCRPRHRYHSAPPAFSPPKPPKNKYKLLALTHIRLQKRFERGLAKLSTIPGRGVAPPFNNPNLLGAVNANGANGGTVNGHTHTIYCLQLYTYPETGDQVLFTGSKDRSVREWSLARLPVPPSTSPLSSSSSISSQSLSAASTPSITGSVERVYEGLHDSSVLSLCVGYGYLASAGSDRRVGLWALGSCSASNPGTIGEGGIVRCRPTKVLVDHEDSVLCVRFNEKTLVSCSKDRTLRTYSFPDLKPQFVLGGHRAAVNAVCIKGNRIVSASGDRSMRLWDADNGTLLQTFENHHSRGIASIDFTFPYVLSGSSDKHLRLFNILESQGWSTSPELDNAPPPPPPLSSEHVCEACGSSRGRNERRRERCHHGDLVRSVALGEEWVVSGSYDLSVKVWNRKTGVLVADLTSGHVGRIFCVGFDCTKVSTRSSSSVQIILAFGCREKWDSTSAFSGGTVLNEDC
ncbi:hypothetical protein JAAARDRAFT_45731 [Jaapia argillacea MUCL 33604]|uniref:F-box domain-containing protein n=1 Tax=Jaapia argillacea MUCL 33604 TaxID=933084 RepID=A0A067QC50_9AGAM|nr:hypothetical protein JAAARDRAFT_45731 [Jaapia argillacea MUCL 33604]